MSSPVEPLFGTGPKTVACIPCFNTEPFIGDIVLSARKYVDQVIVINDGSHDGTAEAARLAGALVVDHGVNRSYGAAIKSCFETARKNAADVVVILDGDGQHQPDEIPRLLTPILRGEADLIIGSRFLTNKHNMPRYRKFGIKVITFLWNFGSKLKVSDAQSGFRAYGKRLLEGLSLSERGMSVSIETLEKARGQKAVIREVPVSCLYVQALFDLEAITHGLSVALYVVWIRLKNSVASLMARNSVEKQSH